MVYSYAWKTLFNPGNAVDFFPLCSSQVTVKTASGFNRANAWLFSELSRLLYVRGDNVTSNELQTASRNRFLHKVGLDERWFYNGKHIQCAIIGTFPEHKQPFSVLVFRGTQGTISNWLFNLTTVLSAWPAGGQVHKGFKLILTEAWNEILLHLEKISGPLYYTGHSLGGALAVLAASLKEPEAVYTFGSPRIGNSEFVRKTNHLNIFRVVNRRDIVAGIPPIPGILHVGKPHWLANSREFDSQRCWFEAPGFLADHSPSNYTVQI
jgi:hypothetical protein